jgi:protein-disulfide isomerase
MRTTSVIFERSSYSNAGEFNNFQQPLGEKTGMPSKVKLAVPISASDHARGACDARTTLVEYLDFECPNCRQAIPALRILNDKYSNHVRFVARHFPQFEVHPNALLAAQASEAAAMQGKFWEMHDLLYANQNQLSLVVVQRCAERLELDLHRFNSELSGERHLEFVLAQNEGGKKSGVRATPSFFINDTFCDISFGVRSLMNTIELLSKQDPILPSRTR